MNKGTATSVLTSNVVDCLIKSSNVWSEVWLTPLVSTETNVSQSMTSHACALECVFVGEI